MEKVLAWYIADQHGWQIDTGKYGKWLKRYLPEEIWEGYVATYAGANYEEIWEALSAMHRLTRQVGPVLAASLGYHYPLEDDRRTVSYLQRVRALPRGATSFDGH
jgi:aminoglycoside 6-adenylyltransferase